MMKKTNLIYLLFICLLLCSCSNPPKEYALSKITLYGPDGGYEGEMLVDEHGNHTQTTLVTDGNVSLTTIEYTYDSHGNYVSRVYESDGSFFKEDFTYEYDDQGNILSCKGIKDGKDMGDYEYVDGKLQKHTTYDDAGNIQEVCEYVYDTNGNIIKEILSTPSINSVVTMENTYDSHNHSTGYIVTSQRGNDTATIEAVYENTYDSDGKLVERLKYNIQNGEKILTGSEVREYR